jgi:hypothetical protein
MPVSHIKPPAKSGSERRDLAPVSVPATAVALAQGVVAEMEDCLAGLDELGWVLPAAHLSQSLELARSKLRVMISESANSTGLIGG